MPDFGPLALARMRAAGVAPRPDDPSRARALSAAAQRAGRTLVDVRRGRVVLGWLEDADTSWGSDDLDLRDRAAPRLARTFAAVLRVCWPSPDSPLYPGVTAGVDDVLEAAATLGTISGVEDGGDAADRHAKGALVTLDACGLVELDRETSTVRLGPAVACWTDADTETARQAWSRLPATPGEGR